MSYRRMIFSIVLAGVLFLVSCDPGTPPPPPNATPVTDVSAGPVLSVVEKQYPAFGLPDVHIFVDDSWSMEEDDIGGACDPARRRREFAYFLYRIIDNWKVNRLVNSDQQTYVWILNQNKEVRKNFPPSDVFQWMNDKIKGDSSYHGLEMIFSDLISDTGTYKDNSVVVFITDGDFRDKRVKNADWDYSKRVVADGVEKLSERNIDTHFFLLCPDRLVDSDLDGSPDTNMLESWIQTIPNRANANQSGFVYGVDVDDATKEILATQTKFNQKETQIMEKFLSNLVSRYQFSEGYRLFGINSNSIQVVIGNLNDGFLPDEARVAFERHGIFLSDPVMIKTIKPGERWEILNGDGYVIKNEKQVLGVYAYRMINWAIVEPGKEYQFLASPGTLFFDVQGLAYDQNDPYSVQFDSAELPLSHYLSPVDGNNCNAPHSIRAFNVNSPLLLQWWNQPFALAVGQTNAIAIFYNDSDVQIHLQSNPNYIFNWDSWKKCIQVHVVYSDDVFRDYMIEKDDITGNYVLNIEDLKATDLFQQASLELSFYLGNSMEVGMQIGDPIKLPYKRVYYPYLFKNAYPYVQDGNLILPYAYHPGLGQGDEYQPVLYFYGANCDISKPNYFKPTGSPHKGVDFEEISPDKYSVRFIDQGVDYMGCTSMDVDWDGDAYRRIVEESRIPKDLSCELQWQSNGYLLEVNCYEK